ncbi:hypothetical protein [Streptomyces goshikiensis]
MHQIKVSGLVPHDAPTYDGPRLPTGQGPSGLAASNLAATTNGQCACGQAVLGFRYEADREGDVTSNLPCGHIRTTALGTQRRGSRAAEDLGRRP